MQNVDFSEQSRDVKLRLHLFVRASEESVTFVPLEAARPRHSQPHKEAAVLLDSLLIFVVFISLMMMLLSAQNSGNQLCCDEERWTVAHVVAQENKEEDGENVVETTYV